MLFSESSADIESGIAGDEEIALAELLSALTAADFPLPPATITAALLLPLLLLLLAAGLVRRGAAGDAGGVAGCATELLRPDARSDCESAEVV